MNSFYGAYGYTGKESFSTSLPNISDRKIVCFIADQGFLKSTSGKYSGIGINEDNSVIAAFFGEIYNYKSLYRKLEDYHDFKKDSYPEIVTHLYEEYNTKMFSKINGTFALALWDMTNKVIILARDIIGGKNIYYTVKNGTLIFSTELFKVMKAAGYHLSINNQALDLYLSLGCIPSPVTIINKIKKLSNASFLIFKGKRTREYEYWNPRYKDIYRDDSNALLDKIYNTLHDSIKIRIKNSLTEDTSSFLSGGLDSGLITSILRRILPEEKINAFTIGFNYEEYNELSSAKRVAEYLKLDHTYKILEGNEILNMGPKLYKIFDEPMFDDSAIATFYATKIASKSPFYIFSGEASDTIFYGVNDIEKIVFLYNRIPVTLRKKLVNPLSLKISNLFDIDTRRKIKKLINLSDSEFNLIKENYLLLNAEELSRIYSSNHLLKHEDPENALLKMYTNTKKLSSDYIDIRHYITFKYGHLENAIIKVDKMCSKMGLSLRLPFTDPRVLDLSFNISPSLKIKRFLSKYLLKKMALKYDLLPKHIIKRKKHGFGTPIEFWLTKELKKEISAELLNNPDTTKFFDTKQIEKLYDSIGEVSYEKRHRKARLIWGIYMFMKWYEYYSNLS